MRSPKKTTAAIHQSHQTRVKWFLHQLRQIKTTTVLGPVEATTPTFFPLWVRTIGIHLQSARLDPQHRMMLSEHSTWYGATSGINL